MILKETLRKLVVAQRQDCSLFDYGIDRELKKQIDLGIPFATVLSGARRCGKSTLLHQLMNEAAQFCYLNFEDPRLSNFEAEDFQKLDEIFKEECGECGLYFFDEIQNAKKWEMFVRSGLDKKKRFVLTGSNASLLSKELGTRLTGRHIRYELFPFSYREMLSFCGKTACPNSLGDYLVRGGFPEYLKYSKDAILHELLNDTLARDIVIRHNLRSTKALTDMAIYLMSNIGKEFSYNGLAKIFELGSVTTAINFVSYLEDSYLLFTVPRFDYSPKKRLVGHKKVYCVDNGLVAANTTSFSSDKGRMLENAVFLHLRADHREIFYFKGKNECDFLVKEKGSITGAFQACYELNEDNKGREIGGIVEAAKEFKLKEVAIITYDAEDELKVDGVKILVKPAWKWLTEK